MRAALALALPLALGACGRKNIPSSEIAGSFVRQDALVPGLTTRLHVTASGVTVTTPSVSMGTSGSVEVGGKPLINGSAQVELGFAAHGAALFASLRCEDDRACAFTTRNGCDGTLTADGKGNVVLIATGECGPWSGKWLAEKTELPSGSVSPPAGSACPPAAPATCPPCPTAAAPPPGGSAAGSAGPASPPTTMGCMTECNHAQTTCVQQCKIGDTVCLQRCTDRTMECAKRCP